MSKKSIVILVMFVLFVASIASGKMYWSKKVANATAQTNEVQTTKTKVENMKTKKEEKQDAKSSFNEAYAKNLPDAVKEKLKKAAQDKKAVNLVIVGDEASSSEKDAWVAKFTANLEASYGKGI